MSEPTTSKPGKLLPPYGGVAVCAAQGCPHDELNEEVGAYLFKDLETGKLLVLCGDCGAYCELNRRDRFVLVAL